MEKRQLSVVHAEDGRVGVLRQLAHSEGGSPGGLTPGRVHVPRRFQLHAKDNKKDVVIVMMRTLSQWFPCP